MGINVLEKKLKKRKKMRRNDPDLVETGDDAVTSIQSSSEKEFLEAATEVNTSERKWKEIRKKKKQHRVSANEESELAHEGGETEPGKLKKACKSKKKGCSSSKEDNKSVNTGEVESYEIYQISSGEEDCSRGMKKWIKEYHDNRPGLELLQQKIDDFITAFEEQEEQARKDREAKIAEDGWTVVVHRKGGKKTSDPESSVAVGSVSQGAVLHRMDKKKSKEVGIDFYRFQRREAQRSEVMKLQSKFEEDKKRIQQLRAARKFKPY